MESVRRTWYPQLKDGLMRDYSPEYLKDHLVICQVDLDNRYLYTVFNNYMEYTNYIMTIPESNRSCYEVVWGDNLQRPYFDIDIAKSEAGHDFLIQDFLDHFVDCLVATCSEDRIMISASDDIVVCTSHGKDKWSFHIILKNYKMQNHTMNQMFCKRIHKRMNPEYAKYLDTCVYKSNQLFRMIGTQKTGSNRMKTIQQEWIWNGQRICFVYPETIDTDILKLNLDLENTLIQYTSQCRDYPMFEGIEIVKPVMSYSVAGKSSSGITPEIAEEMLDMVAEKAGITTDDRRFPYRLQAIKDGLVLLKRIKTSNCPLCNRKHEAENPFLFIAKGMLCFHCRRAPPDARYEIGPIRPEWTQIVPAVDDAVLKRMMATTIAYKRQTIDYKPSSQTLELYNSMF